MEDKARASASSDDKEDSDQAGVGRKGSRGL